MYDKINSIGKITDNPCGFYAERELIYEGMNSIIESIIEDK